MQKTKVKLPNRYNERVYLEKIEDRKYKLICGTYLRIGIINNNDDQYSFVDPCGGPMISIGSKLPVGVVKSIGRNNENYIIEVE